MARPATYAGVGVALLGAFVFLVAIGLCGVGRPFIGIPCAILAAIMLYAGYGLILFGTPIWSGETQPFWRRDATNVNYVVASSSTQISAGEAS